MIPITHTIRQLAKSQMVVVFLTAVIIVCADAAAMAVESAQPSWQRPEAKAVRERAMQWLTTQQPSPVAKEKAEAIWSDLPESPSGTELLSRVCATFALTDSRAGALVDVCLRSHGERPANEQDWLKADSGVNDDAFVTANLRLLYARWLVRHAMYDEACELLEGLKPQDVVDPDSLLFFQAVVYHRLLKVDDARLVINCLLERADDCPRRYRSLAQLMQSDLEGLSDDSLNHIARRMDDVRRRLYLGRPGEKTRQIEDGIIDSLDKLIKKLENQTGQASSSASGGSNQPSKPAADSQPMSGRGPGRVVQRNIGTKKNWGDLPAKQREEALQQISRELPPHYRGVIEQYFRKLADDAAIGEKTIEDRSQESEGRR